MSDLFLSWLAQIVPPTEIVPILLMAVALLLTGVLAARNGRAVRRRVAAETTEREPGPRSILSRSLGRLRLRPGERAVVVIVLWVFALLFVMALGAVFLLVGGVLLGVALPDEKLPFTASLGIGAILVALLGAPFLIWRSVVAQRTLETTQNGLVTERFNAAVASLGADKVVKRQLRDADGQLVYATDEAGKPNLMRPAVEDVTVPNMEVRVGAVLALGRIARENLSFHVQIMQILCAYIRENSPAESAVPFGAPDFPEIGEDEEQVGEKIRGYRKELAKALEDLRKSLPKPRTDIQTALEVLGRRNAEQKCKEGAWPDPEGSVPSVFDETFPEPPPYPAIWTAEAHANWLKDLNRHRDSVERLRTACFDAKCYRLDLRNTNLQDYVLDGLDLRGAMIDRAQMHLTRLEGAKLQGASLEEAELQGAWLRGAHLQGVGLGSAQLQKARLDGARMQGARLEAAQFQVAALEGASLQVARLDGAQMQGAWLRNAQLQGARFARARMQEAWLGGAEMQEVRLGDARMQGAKCGGALMQGASLDGARMSEDTDLSAASLRGAAVRGVDARTTAQLQPFWSVIFADGTLREHLEDENWPGHWRPKKLSHWAWDPTSSPFHIAWREWLATLPAEPR
jgi:uncharacterized protein YjbI with pentapeptide repeats